MRYKPAKPDLNSNRLGLYIKRELYFFYKDIGLIILSALGLMIFVLNLANASSSGAILSFFSGIFSLGSLVFTSIIFKRARKSPDNIFYFMSPASSFEKFLTAWLVSFIGYPLVVIIILLVGGALGSLRHLFSGSIGDYQAFLFGDSARGNMAQLFIFSMGRSRELFSTLFLSLSYAMLVHSIYMYGSIVFKSRAFFKTILACTIFFMALWLAATLLMLVFGSVLNQNGSLMMNFQMNMNINSLRGPLLGLATIFFMITALFFWFLSYTRLKETEII